MEGDSRGKERPSDGVRGEVPQLGPGSKPREEVWGRILSKLKQNVKLMYNFNAFVKKIGFIE